MDILVTYDIATVDPEGERRLARVAAICERYGVRVQYSVFECRIGEAAYVRLLAELSGQIDPANDSVHVYRLPTGAAACRRSLGRPVTRSPGDPWIL